MEKVTTIMVTVALRQRIKLLAVKEGCTMVEWINRRAKEQEAKNEV